MFDICSERPSAEEFQLVSFLGAPSFVVQDHGGHRKAVLHRRHDFRHRIAETSVPDYGDDGTVRRSDLRTDSGGVAKPYQSEIQRRNQAGTLVVREPVRRLQATVSGVYRHDGVARKGIPNFSERAGRMHRDRVVAGLERPLAIKQTSLNLEFVGPFRPLFGWLGEFRRYRPRGGPRVRDHSKLDRKVFPNRGRLDIHLDDSGVATDVFMAQKGRIESEPGAERQHEVRLFGQSGRHAVAARPGLAGEEGMPVRHEVRMACGRHNRHIHLFGQLPEIRRRFAPLESSARDNHRANGLADHPHGVPH